MHAPGKINLLKNSTFPSVKITVGTLIDISNETSKHQFNHDSLLRIVTNEIASFCIDHRLRQMALFRLRQSGQRPDFALC